MAMNFFEFSDPQDGMQGVIKLGHDPQPTASAQPVQAKPAANPSKLDYFKSFCEVDTYTVLSRIKKTLWPFNRQKFFEDKSDLYGALWVPTTLVFILSVSGSISAQFSPTTEYQFDPAAIVTTASVVYFFLFSVPALLSFFLFQGLSLTYYDILSLYGYSYFSFIPSSIISITQITILRWCTFSVSTIWASLLIIKNFYNEINFLDDWKKYASILASISGYIALTLTANLYLFI